MSDYSQTTDFSAKDALSSGDPNKVIYGADVDTELSAISTAVSSKANKVSSATNNNVAKLDTNGDLVDSGYRFTNLSGAVTSTAAELNILDGATATATELNLLSGLTGTIWTSTSDGSGSGLDADTVDGNEASALLDRSNHTGTQTMSTISDAGTLATANTVSQSEIGSNSVGQGELKSTSGTVTTTSTGEQNLTLPGGAYGFWPRTRISSELSEFDAQMAYDTNGASYAARIAFDGLGSSATKYANQYYIQSSPTYWTKDGPVGVYLFLQVEKSSGKVVSGYIAHEAPWHYNGPTNIFSESRDTKGYPIRQEPKIVKELWEEHGKTFDEAFMEAIQSGNRKEMERLKDRRLTDKIEMFNIDQYLQDKDKPLIPHPFNDKPGYEVVVVDLVSNENHEFAELHESGVDVLSLIHQGYINIDNDALTRDAPVMSVSARWKNTSR